MAITIVLERSSISDTLGFSVISSDAFSEADTVFENSGLVAATRYWYRAKAVEGTRQSDYSNVVTAVTNAAAGDTTPPSVPTLSAPVMSSNTATLTWTAATGSPVNYRVTQGRGDGAGNAVTGSAITKDVGNVTTYEWVGLTPNQQYYFRVASVDAAGNVSNASSPRMFGTTDAAPSGSGVLFFENWSGFAIGTPEGSIPQRWHSSADNRAHGRTVPEVYQIVQGTNDKWLRTWMEVGALYGEGRSEYWLDAPVYHRVPFTSLGSGQYGSDSWYFGLRIYVSEDDGPSAGHLWQFHNWDANLPSGFVGYAPTLSMFASPNSVVIYHEGVEGQNQITSPNLMSNPVGRVFDVMIQVKWATKLASQGSDGIVRVWIDDSTTPVYEYLNKQNCHAPPFINTNELFVPYFGHGGYRWSYRASEGQPGIVAGMKWVKFYTQLRVAGANGSRLSVKPTGSRVSGGLS